MSDLQDLYQEVILDHNRSPKNFREIPQATRKAEGYNPLCGDQLTLYVIVDGGVIREISFQGKGCAISKASASLSCAWMKEWAMVPKTGMFQRIPASTLELPSKPALR